MCLFIYLFMSLDSLLWNGALSIGRFPYAFICVWMGLLLLCSDAILITIIFLDCGICIHAKACSCRIHL